MFFVVNRNTQFTVDARRKIEKNKSKTFLSFFPCVSIFINVYKSPTTSNCKVETLGKEIVAPKVCRWQISPSPSSTSSSSSSSSRWLGRKSDDDIDWISVWHTLLTRQQSEQSESEGWIHGVPFLQTEGKLIGLVECKHPFGKRSELLPERTPRWKEEWGG